MQPALRFVVFALTVVLCVGIAHQAAGNADEKTVTITDKDKDAKVDLAKGDKLVVKLPANPSTGFTWVVASEKSDILKAPEKPMFEKDKNAKGVGAGGTQVFTFEATKAGKVDVEMHYKRPFEKDKEPAKTFKFTVTVK
jgi:inhibitor of cysteine peptidase